MIMTEFVALRPKLSFYIVDCDDKPYKKIKGIRKCVIERMIKFIHYKYCLFKYKNDLKVMVTMYLLEKGIKLH